MEINNSKNTNTGPINANNVHIGDNYYKSAEYEEFQKNISRLKELIELAKTTEKKIQYNQELQEEEDKLEDFKRGVISLAETFQKIVIDTERLKTARQLFNEGKIKEARAILDTEQIGTEQEQLLKHKKELQNQSQQNQEDLHNNANEYLVLAMLTDIDYEQVNRFEKTVECFEQSLRSERNPETLFSYAHFLQKHNQNNSSEPLYEEVLLIYRTLAETNPQIYLPYVATILNNLAVLISYKNEFTKAEQSYKEALSIRRFLANTNPQTYLPDVGMTLNNLATLLKNKNEFEKAGQTYEEALSIYQTLIETDPQIYLPYLAGILNNLATLQCHINEYVKAQQGFEESLSIRRNFAKANPQAYLPDVARTLTNLANLQSIKNEFGKAEQSYEEVLSIRRTLAETNPQTYLPEVASTLNNLAILQKDKKEFGKAEQSYEEALTIYRTLVENNPQTFLPNVGMTLNNLANLQQTKNELEKAEQSYQKVISIYRTLAETNPQIYLPDLAATQINLGIFYQKSKVDRDLSIQFIDAALINLSPFCEIPYIQEYLEGAFKVLTDWGIDVEEYLNDKIASNPES